MNIEFKMETKKKENTERLDNFFREDYCLGLRQKEKNVEEPKKEYQCNNEAKTNIELPYSEMYY